MPHYQIDKFRFLPNLPASPSALVNVYYKPYLDSSFISVATNVPVLQDGSLLSPLTISNLFFNTRYTIKVTDLQTQNSYQEDIYFPCESKCPNGYILSPDSTYCYKIETVSAIQPTYTSPYAVLTPKAAVQYSTCGAYIYTSSPAYNINGTGSSSQITLANPFWFNGIGNCSDGGTVNGAMNRSGVWANIGNPVYIGFSVCINIPTSKVYYIGIGCDNYATIKVDGVTILQQNQTALNAQYGVSGATFKVWHIYPVYFSAGIHIIELIGTNDVSYTLASLGAEIYDNTAAEIIAATTYGGLNLIFSTKDQVGNRVQIGSGGTGYSCLSGYSLSSCGSPVVCQKITTTNILC